MNNTKQPPLKINRPSTPIPQIRTPPQSRPKMNHNDAARQGLVPYMKVLNVMAIVFACLTFVSIIISVATKIKVAYNGSNLLACFNLVTAFLSIVWINEQHKSVRMITARFWVAVSCVIFVSVYLVFQITALAKCQNPTFLEESPVEQYMCTEEYLALVGTIVYGGVVQLALITQIVVDLKLRAYIIVTFYKQPPTQAQQ